MALLKHCSVCWTSRPSPTQQHRLNQWCEFGGCLSDQWQTQGVFRKPVWKTLLFVHNDAEMTHFTFWCNTLCFSHYNFNLCCIFPVCILTSFAFTNLHSFKMSLIQGPSLFSFDHKQPGVHTAFPEEQSPASEKLPKRQASVFASLPASLALSATETLTEDLVSPSCQSLGMDRHIPSWKTARPSFLFRELTQTNQQSCLSNRQTVISQQKNESLICYGCNVFLVGFPFRLASKAFFWMLKLFLDAFLWMV